MNTLVNSSTGRCIGEVRRSTISVIRIATTQTLLAHESLAQEFWLVAMQGIDRKDVVQRTETN